MPIRRVPWARRRQFAAALAGSLLIALSAAAPQSPPVLGSGTQLLGPRVQISNLGPDGDSSYDAFAPTVAFNGLDNEFLVVWTSFGPAGIGPQVYAQRLDATTGGEIGQNDIVVATDVVAAPAAVAYNSIDHEYLVLWTEWTGSTTANVFGRRLAADGTLLDAELQLTDYGDTGVIRFSVIFNHTTAEYLIVWTGRIGWILYCNGGDRPNPCLSGVSTFATRFSRAGVPLGGRRLTPLEIPGWPQEPVGSAAPAAVFNSTNNEYCIVCIHRQGVAGRRLSPDLSSQIGGCGGWAWSYTAGDAGPSVAWNDHRLEYLVAGHPYVQRFDSSGKRIGTPLSFMSGRSSKVTFNPLFDEYLVSFEMTDPATLETEIYGQRLSSTGQVIVPGGFRISRMGPDGDPTFAGREPSMALSPATGQHLIVWSGDDDSAGHVDDEFEIYGQRYVPPEPFTVGLTTFATDGGWIATHSDAPELEMQGWTRVPWDAYIAAGGATRPAMGDVDGDGRDETVVGLDADGQNWLAVLDATAAGHALRWIQLGWPSVGTATYPAVGNVDADPRAEIVIGFGPGTAGWILILDDAATNFALLGWRQVAWADYVARDGRTHPAIGDVTGDGVGEILVGLGPGSLGWVEVFNGAAAGFTHRGWVEVPWPSYNTANGTTWPAAGDVDGDGSDEVVIGLDAGALGWLAVMDGEAAGFALLRWLQVGWPDYNDLVGATHPAVGNLDGDAADEILVGLSANTLEGGWFQLFDDLVATAGSDGLSWGRVTWPAYEASGGGTYPSIGRRTP